jgi:Fic family protein
VVHLRSFEAGMPLLASVPGPVARALARADTARGSEALHLAQLPGLLRALSSRARVESIKASSALEGVVVPDERRADRIIAGAASSFRTRSEQELAGYRDALDYVWQTDWKPLNAGLLLHLHRLLVGRTPAAGSGGRLKEEDNLVVDKLADGTRRIRFRPAAASATPFFTAELVDRYVAERNADEHHPLLLVGLAVLDFLVIHPFEDGNGRIARILTNALLDDAGYGVARYVSLEQLVASTDEEYYATLLASTHAWHDARHDPWPWLSYFVRQVGEAYALFEQRAAAAGSVGTKRDRVRDYVVHHAPRSFRIADIRAAVPGVSDGTIRLALDELRQAGRIDVDGPGRGATWTRR